MKIMAIAVAGMCGALARYFLSGWVNSLSGSDFPYGTLVVNIIGSFLISFCLVLLVDRFAVDPVWRFALTIGFLGSFTTFATFEYETLRLIQNGLLWTAVSNILYSVVLGLFAVFLGYVVAKTI